MMKPRYSKNRGFTLVELIASLILVGLLGAVAGMGIVQMTDGFMFSKKNTESGRTARLVMARLVKELQSNDIVISSGDETSITFKREEGDLFSYTVGWEGAGHPLKIKKDTPAEEDPLTDATSIQAFSLGYLDSYDGTPLVSHSASTKLIQIALKLKCGDDIPVTFTDRVFLRD
jgi:prepilin-type N-terminal cleavage/methylation domain-containing protein